MRLRNTGPRAGKHVVQVYAERPGSSVERPARTLAGFAVVRAEAGESVDVPVSIHPRALRHWDGERSRWAVEPGPLLLGTGSSAGDVSRQVTVELSGEPA